MMGITDGQETISALNGFLPSNGSIEAKNLATNATFRVVLIDCLCCVSSVQFTPRLEVLFRLWGFLRGYFEARFLRTLETRATYVI